VAVRSHGHFRQKFACPRCVHAGVVRGETCSLVLTKFVFALRVEAVEPLLRLLLCVFARVRISEGRALPADACLQRAHVLHPLIARFGDLGDRRQELQAPRETSARIADVIDDLGRVFAQHRAESGDVGLRVLRVTSAVQAKQLACLSGWVFLLGVGRS
jgi:hypothetical protein